MRSPIAQRIAAHTPEYIKIFSNWHGDLIVRVGTLLDEKGMKDRNVAEQEFGPSSEVLKWLDGQHDFTLLSLAKLQAELGATLILPYSRDDTKSGD